MLFPLAVAVFLGQAIFGRPAVYGYFEPGAHSPNNIHCRVGYFNGLKFYVIKQPPLGTLVTLRVFLTPAAKNILANADRKGYQISDPVVAEVVGQLDTDWLSSSL